ncbi:hypothetical protein DFJ73DRAFT_929098 [Zopfochytrium polystomum]|nr:hypothetical protein DFJ73DRAFT_929098 [Zopfochytrium polystomum]
MHATAAASGRRGYLVAVAATTAARRRRRCCVCRSVHDELWGELEQIERAAAVVNALLAAAEAAMDAAETESDGSGSFYRPSRRGSVDEPRSGAPIRKDDSPFFCSRIPKGNLGLFSNNRWQPSAQKSKTEEVDGKVKFGSNRTRQDNEDKAWDGITPIFGTVAAYSSGEGGEPRKLDVEEYLLEHSVLQELRGCIAQPTVQLVADFGWIESVPPAELNLLAPGPRIETVKAVTTLSWLVLDRPTV